MGARCRSLAKMPDTSTTAGKCLLDMLGVFAEFYRSAARSPSVLHRALSHCAQTNLRRERQLEGIAKAKAEGVYRGRKPSIDPAQVKKLNAEGLGAAAIAGRLKMAGLQFIG